MVERSPEKAGVGGSTPSRGTIFSLTYNPQELKPVTTCHRINSGAGEVCHKTGNRAPKKIRDSANGGRRQKPVPFVSFVSIFSTTSDRVRTGPGTPQGGQIRGKIRKWFGAVRAQNKNLRNEAYSVFRINASNLWRSVVATARRLCRGFFIVPTQSPWHTNRAVATRTKMEIYGTKPSDDRKQRKITMLQ